MEWYDYNSSNGVYPNYQGQYDCNYGYYNGSNFDTSYDYQYSHNVCMNPYELPYIPNESYVYDTSPSFQPEMYNYSQPDSSESCTLDELKSLIASINQRMDEFLKECDNKVENHVILEEEFNLTHDNLVEDKDIICEVESVGFIVDESSVESEVSDTSSILFSSIYESSIEDPLEVSCLESSTGYTSIWKEEVDAIEKALKGENLSIERATDDNT